MFSKSVERLLNQPEKKKRLLCCWFVGVPLLIYTHIFFYAQTGPLSNAQYKSAPPHPSDVINCCCLALCNKHGFAETKPDNDPCWLKWGCFRRWRCHILHLTGVWWITPPPGSRKCKPRHQTNRKNPLETPKLARQTAEEKHAMESSFFTA